MVQFPFTDVELQYARFPHVPPLKTPPTPLDFAASESVGRHDLLDGDKFSAELLRCEHDFADKIVCYPLLLADRCAHV